MRYYFNTTARLAALCVNSSNRKWTVNTLRTTTAVVQTMSGILMATTSISHFELQAVDAHGG